MIVAGFGFRKGATLVSLEAALELAQEGQPPVTALAAPNDKASELEPLAGALGVTLIAVPVTALITASVRSQSVFSMRARNTGSVAEAAALAAAGRGASLLCTRSISPDRMATCAIARGIPQ